MAQVAKAPALHSPLAKHIKRRRQEAATSSSSSSSSSSAGGGAAHYNGPVSLSLYRCSDGCNAWLMPMIRIVITKRNSFITITHHHHHYQHRHRHHTHHHHNSTPVIPSPIGLFIPSSIPSLQSTYKQQATNSNMTPATIFFLHSCHTQQRGSAACARQRKTMQTALNANSPKIVIKH